MIFAGMLVVCGVTTHLHRKDTTVSSAPSTRPKAAARIPRPRNCRRICAGRAPSAMRTPISDPMASRLCHCTQGW